MSSSRHMTASAEAPMYVRGFVDLLTEKAHWPLVTDGGPEAGAYATRRRLPLPGGPVSVDAVRLAAGGRGRLSPSGDEFVLVLSGDAGFHQAGADLRLGAGEAGVVLRDQPLDWRSEGGAELIVMRCEAGGGAGAQAPARIDLDGLLTPSNPPLAEHLLTSTPQCRGRRDYASASGEFVAGVWDSTAYHRRAFTYRHYELMYLLDGSITLVDPDGREGRFDAGAVVLLQQGGACSWEHRGYVRKVYSTYRPAE